MYADLLASARVCAALLLSLGALCPPAAAETLAERVCASWSIPERPGSPRGAEAAYGELMHAETHYWWARDSANSLAQHCWTRGAYLRAQAHLDGAGEPGLDRATALGLEQVGWRIDNSFDSFRNIFPLAWWIAGDEAVLESQDGPGELPDYFGTAAENAFHVIGGVLTDFGRPLSPAVIRCRGDDANCDGLRDLLSRVADAHPRLVSMPDDAAARSMGPAWTDLLSAEDLPLASARALRDYTGYDAAVVIDMVVADTLSSPLDAARLELSADVWDLQDGSAIRVAVGTGIGADGVPTRNFDLVWIGLCLLAGLAAAALDRRLGTGASQGAPLERALQIGAGLILGGALGIAAAQLTAPLVPDMEMLALTPDGWLRLPALIWPLAYGGILLAGPTALCAFAALGAVPRVSPALAERLDLGLLIPGTLCGALALGLDPIPLAMGWDGVLACGALALPAVIIGVLAGERTEQLRGGIDADATRHVVPVVSTLVGLVALFPLALTGRYSLLVFAGGGLLTVWVARLRRGAASEAAPTQRGLVLKSRPGSLRRPHYVSAGERSVAPLAEAIRQGELTLVEIEGAAGLGKSRMAEELVAALGEGWRVGWGEAEAPHIGEGPPQPYGAISRALGELVDQAQLEIDAIYQRQVAAHELAGAAGEVLDFLPGLGLLMGMGGEVDSAQLTQDRLRRDVLAAVIQRLQKGPALLVIDDLQWADDSSLALLEHLLVELSVRDDLPHPFAAVLCFRPVSDEIAAWLRQLERRVEERKLTLQPMERDAVISLLSGAGFQALNEDFIEAVREQVGGVPLHVVLLLQELERAGQLQIETGGSEGGAIYSAPEGLDADAMRRLVPGEIADLERQRLARLTTDDLLLLQGAALCGRTFNASDLSSGFGMKRLDVLRRLKDIEDTQELITDLEDDDHFRFETDISRSLLVEMAAPRRGPGQRELVKEFHHRVVGALLMQDRGEGWREDTDAARVTRHAMSAGQRRQGVAARFAARAAVEAARRFAWPEALGFIEIARERRSHLPQDELAALDLLEARVRRGRGGPGDREIALVRFAELLGSPHVELFPLARDWFEACFEQKTPASLEALSEHIRAVRETNAGRDGLVVAVCDFYAKLVDAARSGTRGPNAEAASALGALSERLQVLDDPRARERELLLAWVLQSQANNTADNDAFVALCERSLALKVARGDLAGQALSKGVLGTHYLFQRSDPRRARELLEEDLAIVDQMGDLGTRGGLINKLATADWMEASGLLEGDARAPELRASALEKARESFAVAVHTERSGDLIHAALSVLTWGAAIGDRDAVDEVGQALLEPPEAWPWDDPDTLWAGVPAWLKKKGAEDLANAKASIQQIGAGQGWLVALEKRLGS